MPSPTELIKETVDLVKYLQTDNIQLHRSGRTYKACCPFHDDQTPSFVVWPETQTWRCFGACNTGGDIFTYYQYRHHCDFKIALHALAAEAGIEVGQLTVEQEQAYTFEQQRRHIFSVAADHYHNTLLNHPDARPAHEYCRQRGWDEETIRRERIGYSLDLSSTPSVYSTGYQAEPAREQTLYRKLMDEGLAEHPAAIAVLSLPPVHLIYNHTHGGQTTYLSARSISEKRHYNLPETIKRDGNYFEAAGPKQVYWNHPHQKQAAHLSEVLLVEGQADAISLGQLGFDAVALCGSDIGVTSILRRRDVPFVALDNDDTGRRRVIEIALQLGPLTRIVTWPASFAEHPVKDANDLLRVGATVDDITQLLKAAPTVLQILAGMVGQETNGDVRNDYLKRFFQAYCRLEKEDSFLAVDLKLDCAGRMGMKINHFNRLHKEQKQAEKAEAEGDDQERPPVELTYSSGGFAGGYLWEQCVIRHEDGSAESLYSVRLPDGSIVSKTSMEIGGTTYVPYPARLDLIHNESVLFPERPEEYGSQQQLVADLQTFIHRFLDVDPFYERLASYYVLFTWLYNLFPNLAYLRALGDYGTGKSRFLQVIGALCYRPMFVAGATTVSPVFRIIDMFRGTLIMDEADFANSDAESELIKIINLGYDRRQGVVYRTEKDPGSANREYWPVGKYVYGPKILATRREFQDKATESRCLTKRMTSTRPRPDIPLILTDEFWAEAQKLRNKLLMFRLKEHRPITLDPSLIDASIEPRLNQIIMPLKSIIKDPDMIKEIDAFMYAYNQHLIETRQLTLPAIVLQAVVDIYYGPPDILGERDLSFKGIADRVNKHLTEWAPDQSVTAHKVSSLLSQDLGLTGRKEAKSRARRGRSMLDVTEHELQSLMQRYGIESLADD